MTLFSPGIHVCSVYYISSPFYNAYLSYVDSMCFIYPVALVRREDYDVGGLDDECAVIQSIRC